MKAAIYSRKSKFTGKGDSIENQIQLCMDYSKSIGINKLLVYEDDQIKIVKLVLTSDAYSYLYNILI